MTGGTRGKCSSGVGNGVRNNVIIVGIIRAGVMAAFTHTERGKE